MFINYFKCFSHAIFSYTSWLFSAMELGSFLEFEGVWGGSMFPWATSAVALEALNGTFTVEASSCKTFFNMADDERFAVNVGITWLVLLA